MTQGLRALGIRSACSPPDVTNLGVVYFARILHILFGDWNLGIVGTARKYYICLSAHSEFNTEESQSL